MFSAASHIRAVQAPNIGRAHVQLLLVPFFSVFHACEYEMHAISGNICSNFILVPANSHLVELYVIRLFNNHAHVNERAL